MARPRLKCPEWGNVRREGSKCVPKEENKPIFKMNNSPSIYDIVGDDWDEALSMIQEMDDAEYDRFVSDHRGKPSERAKEDFINDFFYRHNELHSDLSHEHYEQWLADMDDLIRSAGFEEGDIIIVEGRNVDWRGRSGERAFEHDGNPRKFVDEVFGEGFEWTAAVWEIGTRRLEATVSSHDVPTGSGRTVRLATRKEAEQFWEERA